MHPHTTSRVAYVVVAALFAAACSGDKKQPDDESNETSAVLAEPSNTERPPTIDAAPAPPALDGTRVSLTMCNLGEFVPKDYIRSLYADNAGRVYVMNDSFKPHELVPTPGGCGLEPGRIIEAETLALGDHGELVAAESQWTDDGTSMSRPECESVEVRFSWRGAFVNGRAYTISSRYGRDTRLQIEDPRTKPCVPALLDDNPTGRLAGIAANSDHLLVLEFHGSGHDNVVWRYNLDGTLRDKVGLDPEGESFIGWADDVATCADGVCVTNGGSDLVIIAKDGVKVASHKLSTLNPDLGIRAVTSLVENPGHGLYALVELAGNDDAKRFDVARIDGIYATRPN